MIKRLKNLLDERMRELELFSLKKTQGLVGNSIILYEKNIVGGSKDNGTRFLSVVPCKRTKRPWTQIEILEIPLKYMKKFLL